ncbi:MAG: extracellular solute-binding protein [Actinobacteria bacterium]|nr:extracellular solute-binding protein [Actinomycetota bacterium]
MTSRSGRIAATVALVLAVAACGAPPTATTAGPQGADTASKYEQYEALSGQERRDRLVADAKAEGVLSLYTSMTSDVADAVTKAFTADTGVKVELYRAGSETVLQRVLQESSANHSGADVMETDALEMAAISKEGLAAPYRGERRDLVGDEGKFEYWTATRYNLFSPSWNTTKVAPGQEPTSWEDLADPKWNGQLAMELSDYDWYLTLYEYWQEHGKSTEEIDRLFSDMANGAKVVKGHTVMGELLSAGQFSVAASNYTYLVQRVQDKGAPVAYQPMAQPVIARANGAALLKSAAHPAAALLFVDWLLTEGQQVLVDQGLTPSIEPEGLKDPLEGLEVIPVDVQKLLDEQELWSDRYNALIEKSDQVGG